MNSTTLKKLAGWTLLVGISGTVVGYFLLMMWGLSAQSGNSNGLLAVAGVVGYILLLPTMVLGYAVESAGGFGMEIETLLMAVFQFIGYFCLMWTIHSIHIRFRRLNGDRNSNVAERT